MRERLASTDSGSFFIRGEYRNLTPNFSTDYGRPPRQGERRWGDSLEDLGVPTTPSAIGGPVSPLSKIPE